MEANNRYVNIKRCLAIMKYEKKDTSFDNNAMEEAYAWGKAKKAK